MVRPIYKCFSIAVLATALLLFSTSRSSMAAQTKDRILRRIENASTVPMHGNVHPLALAQYDRGEVSGSFRVERVTMVFKPTDEQSAALNELLQQQQDPASPNYHKWLTPEEYGERFGLSANDLNQIAAWLQAQGFTVNSTARNRSSITFTGSAGQIEQSFRTAIHQYVIDGETFFANATEPSVPPAFADLVLGFRSLNNFRLKPRARRRSVADGVSSDFTSASTGNHYIAPDDLATIYDFKSLFARGLDGSGQTIAIVGQTNIQISDIQAFRSAAGLPPNDPEVILVPGSSDPGTNNDDLGEADLDLEWAGAAAPNARLVYVNSGNGALDSLQYAVDQNLAAIISVSYGACEQNFGPREMSLLAAIGQQANAQGITILAAAGDSGAADCETSNTRVARRGLAVDAPGSLPYVTSMGGSEFQESGNPWSATNNSSLGSALSYIPEIAWNDTSVSRVLSAGGGGRSVYFQKPSWQAGSGVPNDQARDVPDVSLNASVNHDGYLMCTLGSCVDGFRGSNGGLVVVGGTSVSAPVFAGVVAIINQQAVSRQGNINSVLYQLATIAPSSFHDIVSGNNQVPCQIGTANCTTGAMGFAAGPGYDQATGLGSVDVANLVLSWPSPSGTSAPPAFPTVTGIAPPVGVRGTTISAVLNGTNLFAATSVSFGAAGITAAILDGSTSTQILLSVIIAPDAAVGPVSVTVTTPAGSATATSIFAVQAAADTTTAKTTSPQPIPEVEQGTVQSGYVVITPDSNQNVPEPTVTFGIVNGGVVQSQGAILGGSMTTSATFFVDVVPGFGRSVGVALANPNNTSNLIGLTLQDASGTVVSTTTISLEPLHQKGRFVTELFSAEVIGAAFSGSLRLQSALPFSSVGLRFAGIEFSTLPITGGAPVAGVPSRTFADGGTVGGPTALIIPQFAMGGGWASEVALTNNGSTTMTGRVDLFNAAGNPLSVKLNNSTQSTFRYSIPSGGTLLLAPRDVNGQSPM